MQFRFRLFTASSIIIAVLIACASIMVSCSKKKKSNPVNPVEPKQPTVAISTPATPTLTVPNVTDSVTVTAKITDPDKQTDTLYFTYGALSIAVPAASLVGDSSSQKLKFSTDTLIVYTKVISKTKLSASDTVTFFRTLPVTDPTKAKVSGTLMKEATSRDKNPIQRIMTARNAQGTSRIVSSVVPVSGADILLYDANSLSTKSDTSVSTDATGKWNVEMKPGTYFAFAVYFDRENLQMVTAALSNIEAVKAKETKTDSATATNDDVKPMAVTFMDASEANSDHIFIASDVALGLPIVMSFSEPITRSSAGDSIKGIILGEVNADSSGLPLIDTIPVSKYWNPDGKEIRLVYKSGALKVGHTYKVVMPTTVKDLALNKLDNTYYGVFKVVAASSVPFAIKAISPVAGDSIIASFPVELVFSKPVDVLSLNKHFTLTTNDSIATKTTKGYFEAKGTIAKFKHSPAWKHGVTYTMTILKGTKDLSGSDSLTRDTSVNFVVKKKDQFELQSNVGGEIAAAVKLFTGAYLAGDFETFSNALHAKVEVIDYDEKGIERERKQRDKFLENCKSDIEERNRFSKIGMISPKWYSFITDTKDTVVCWKMTKNSKVVYFEDLGGSAIGKTPRAFDADKKSITTSIQFVNRGIVYLTDTFLFSPDMSKAIVDKDARDKDPSFFGKLLKEQTNVETQEILLDVKTNFDLKNVEAQGDSGKVMMLLRDVMHFKDGKVPYPVKFGVAVADSEVNIQTLQIKMIKEKSKWMVLQIVSRRIFSGSSKDFDPNKVKAEDLQIKNIQQTNALLFVSPVHKAEGVKTPVVFKWRKPGRSGPKIGGYLFAISNEMSGGNKGLLIFTKNESITIETDGKVDTGATVLSINPSSLHVPLPRFGQTMTSLTLADSAVYVWKVVGISDTTAGAVSADTFKVIADSDFGPQYGVGIFTLLPSMPNLTNKVNNMNNQPFVDHFADRDGDSFPDWVEIAFKTNINDPGSYPNFTLDNDQDGIVDFLETLAGTNPNDKASIPADLDPKNGIPDAIEKDPSFPKELSMDDDKDLFVNEIERMYGTSPWDPNSKPSKTIKASVPTGRYWGYIFMGQDPMNMTKKLVKFSLLSDSTGDIVTLSSTELEGVAKDGINLSMKLQYQMGEFVFYIPMVSGINTNKFIKPRFMMRNGNLYGPVDIADRENGGGPYIGQFAATTDTANAGTLTPGGGGGVGPGPGPMNPQNNNGMVNLGPAPGQVRDILTPKGQNDTSKFLIKLWLEFDAGGKPYAKFWTEKLSVGDTLRDSNVFWNPGMYPAIGFNCLKNYVNYHFDGNLFKMGNAPSMDTIVLNGFYKTEKTSGPGPNEYKGNEFALALIRQQGQPELDPKKPVGMWQGYYRVNTATVNNNPMPFMGTEPVVTAAKTATNSKGVVIGGAKEILTLDSAKRENANSPWIIKGGQTWFYILEKPGNYQEVYTMDISVNNAMIKVMVLAPRQNNQQEIVPFQGDTTMIRNALNQSDNKVRVLAPQPFNIDINPATVTKIPDPKNNAMMICIVSALKEPNRRFVFIGMNPATTLKIEEGKPCTMEAPSQRAIKR